MKRFEYFAIAATSIICLGILVMSVYPGWLNDLLFMAIMFGICVVPIAVVVFSIFLVWRFRRGDRRLPWNQFAITFSILLTTAGLLWFYIPRRIAFATCHSSFQDVIDDGVVSDSEFDCRIGLYQVDKCLTDKRGGTYFRVYTGLHGIGPDVMSYGFCYHPNGDGSPFGAAKYRTSPLRDGWYWFQASDDSF